MNPLMKALKPFLGGTSHATIGSDLTTIVSGIGALTQHFSTTGILMYKAFQKSIFNKYDAPARDKAKKFWSSQGYTCTDHADEYDVDLVVEKDNKRFYCEVEVKTTWHGQEFHYDTLHIPARKAKFLSKPTQFMVFNNSMTRAAIVGRNKLLGSATIEVPNRKIAFGERFFDVPKEDLFFVPIEI
jgi:hypothetical protein